MDSTAYVSGYSSKEKRFLKFTFYTICSLFLLILAGGVVRSTGSGMGCPDWPKCFNQWVPPTQVSQLPADYQEVYVAKRLAKNNRFAKLLDGLGYSHLANQVRSDQSILKSEAFNVWNTYTEYINRLIGALTGFLMLAMTYSAFSIRKSNRSTFVLSMIALILVVVQAWIGSWVVSTNLLSWVITVHMVLALIILALVIVAYSKIKYRYLEVAKLSISKLRLAETAAWACIVLTFIQIVFGTELREAIDKYAAFWNHSNRGAWVKLSGDLFIIHRSFSIILVLSAVFCTWYINTHFGVIKRLKRFANASIFFLFLQIITGVVLAYFALPPAFQTLHLVIASFLIGAQVMQIVMITIYKRSIALELIS